MVAKSFELGDLVWAKMKSFPYWPGKIIDPPAGIKSPKSKKCQHYVLFYGYENHNWIPDENILLHNEKLVEKFTQKKRSAMYEKAVERIIEESKKSSKSYFDRHIHEDVLPQYQRHENNLGSLAGEGTSPKSSSIPKSIRKTSIPKSIRKPSIPKSIRKPSITKRKFPTEKIHKRRLSSDDDNDDEADNSGFSGRAKCRKDESLLGFETLLANIPPNIGYNTVPSSQNLLQKYEVVKCPPTPPINLEDMNEILKAKNIQPTAKKIGFIGLGKLAQGIVKNLLQSGHYVTIWTMTECEAFIEIGAVVVMTPADVVSASDIIFCCMSDADVAKRLVFGNCGILKGLENSVGENKGYVEMTSMDAKTSCTISEEIKLKGGLYLEAPFTGSRLQAIEGTLLILAAGDKSLYEECKSCFEAIASQSMFISHTVGDASKYKIVHNTFLGTMYAALAESIALIRSTELDEKKFLDILQQNAPSSKKIADKGRLMVGQDYTSNTPLKHVQKDLKLALDLGHSCDQPLPITAQANEVYKRLKTRYAEHDVCAVYEGTKV